MMDNKQKGKRKQQKDMATSDEEEINQRTIQNNCPTVCSKFKCKVDNNCHNECDRLDFAQALICELCGDPCENEKQKKIFLNTKYYEQKKKEFSSKLMDGVSGIKERHTYLETRLKELRLAMLKCKLYQYGKKTEISNEGDKIKFELEIIRKHMDMLEIPYTKEIDI